MWRKHFPLAEKSPSVTGVIDSVQLIKLLGHMDLDRKIRGRAEGMDEVDMRRIIHVDIIDKLPDTGYVVPEGVVDLRFRRANVEFTASNAVQEFRNLKNGVA